MLPTDIKIQPAVLRLSDLTRYLAVGRSRIYQLRREPDFPKPIRLGQRSVGWRRSEIDRWVESRSRVELPPVQNEPAAAGQ